MTSKVSVHGGHSGEFCGHATDTLEQIVKRYIELGFEWVCLTEHMPLDHDCLLPQADFVAGLDSSAIQKRFTRYFAEARRLQKHYSDSIEIFVGFETEVFDGYEPILSKLIECHKPDMLVGSVHHVNNIMIDGSEEDFKSAILRSGGIENLYCDYFDQQLALINSFEPEVIGHFDLIRLHDPDYKHRWDVPEIKNRALRNLARIKELGLILDLNLRAMSKGNDEPYISKPFLRFAVNEGISIMPGDDSHGVDGVAANWEQGITALAESGGNMHWSKPKDFRPPFGKNGSR